VPAHDWQAGAGSAEGKRMTRDPNRYAGYVPLVGSVLGGAVVFSSVVFFFVDDDSRRIFAASAGLFVLILAIWFAANPYFVNTREYLPLRAEVDRFLELVRDMNALAEAGDTFGELAEVKESMLRSVDRIVQAAGIVREGSSG
jgi:hypothetical protein